MKTSPQHHYASFLDRLLASFIDGIVTTIISAIFLGIGGFSFDTNNINYNGVGLGTLAGIAYVFYFWIKEDGQTIGKKLMGIKVVTVSGKPIDFGIALTRYIGYMISGLFMNIGYLWAIFDSNKQAWHDKLANTYVVKTGIKGNTGLVTLILIMFGIGTFFTLLIVAAFILGMLVLYDETKNQPGIVQDIKTEVKKSYQEELNNTKTIDIQNNIEYKLNSKQ